MNTIFVAFVYAADAARCLVDTFSTREDARNFVEGWACSPNESAGWEGGFYVVDGRRVGEVLLRSLR